MTDSKPDDSGSELPAWADDEETITVVAETTGHIKFEVPASDVGKDSVSLDNAEEVEREVHGDWTGLRRADTGTEVTDRE